MLSDLPRKPADLHTPAWSDHVRVSEIWGIKVLSLSALLEANRMQDHYTFRMLATTKKGYWGRHR